MLVLATTLAALFGAAKPAALPIRPCPAVPVAVIETSARTCPALEVSGRTDASALALDPAYDVMVPPAELARPGRGEAMLAGYAADGRTLFALPVAAGAPFHAYVPLAPALASALARLALTANGATVDRTATTHAEPAGEAISVDETHALFAWNARLFPGVRIGDGTGAQAFGSGSSTYQQLGVATRARRLVVEFSDGLHSATRTFAVFGR
jgi:hypothetical protein